MISPAISKYDEVARTLGETLTVSQQLDHSRPA